MTGTLLHGEAISALFVHSLVLAVQGKSMSCKSFMTREASATGRARGITALAVNNHSSKLLASSADHHIYMFDCIVPEREPDMYTGHVNNSFYVKSTFSPDGRFILSGSTDNHVYLWDVAHPLIPPLRLKGHTGEVSDVAWSPTEFWKLASSSDDTTVRTWTIDRAMSDHLRKHEHLRHGEHSGAEVRRAYNSFADVEERLVYSHNENSRLPVGAGVAEVPVSWSQPLQQSEDDRLTCHETMMFSDTVSSSQETAETIEYGEGRPSQVPSIPEYAASPTEMTSEMSPTGSPFFPDVMEGEVNGSLGALGATPRTVQATRMRRTLIAGDGRGRDCRSPTLKQPSICEYFNASARSREQHAEPAALVCLSDSAARAEAASGDGTRGNAGNASAGQAGGSRKRRRLEP
jgi:hypothetical protein